MVTGFEGNIILKIGINASNYKEADDKLLELSRIIKNKLEKEYIIVRVETKQCELSLAENIDKN